MVAHRIAVDAAAVGEPYAAVSQRIEAEPIVAGRAYLDETGVRGPIEHLVGPEPGHHQDVSLGDAGKGFVPAPGLEVRDPGPAQREPLSETICDVGEMDDERIVAWEAASVGHREPP